MFDPEEKCDMRVITTEQLLKCQFAHSEIIDCKIKQEGKFIQITKMKWSTIVKDIIGRLNEYEWCNGLRTPYEYKNADRTMRKILDMSKHHNLTINLTVKLNTGKIIVYQR